MLCAAEGLGMREIARRARDARLAIPQALRRGGVGRIAPGDIQRARTGVMRPKSYLLTRQFLS